MYKQVKRQRNEQPLTHLHFRKILVDKLRGDFRQPRDRASISTSNSDEIRLNGKLHVIFTGTKKDCKVCSNRNKPGGRHKTTYYCDTCPDKPRMHLVFFCIMFYKLSYETKLQIIIFVIKIRVDNHTHIRHIMLYHFEKGWKAAQSFRDLNELFGEVTISESRCREWFARFKSGDTSLEDKPGRGRSSDFDDQALLAAVEEDESLTTRMLAYNFNVDHSTIVRRLKKLGKVWKLAGWVPPRTQRQQ
ncbi:Histone-lysine N-methyltransferase SETMAR [Anthophora retusa]